MDRKAAIVIAICVFVLVLNFTGILPKLLFPQQQQQQEQAQPEADQPKPPARPPVDPAPIQPAPGTQSQPATVPATRPAPPPVQPAAPSTGPEELMLPEGGESSGSPVWLKLTKSGAGIEALWLRDYNKADTSERLQLLGAEGSPGVGVTSLEPSLLLTLLPKGRDPIPLTPGNPKKKWNARRDEAKVVFWIDLPEVGVRVSKVFSLQKADDYLVNVEVQFDLLPGAPPVRELRYEITSANGLPLEGLDFDVRIYRSVMFGQVPNGETSVKQIWNAPTDDEKPYDTGTIRWLGMETRYFTALLIPDVERVEDSWADSAEWALIGSPSTEEKKLSNFAAKMTCKPIDLTAENPSHVHKYLLFAGPKLSRVLAADALAPYELESVLSYGWKVFSWVAKLLIGFLELLGSLVHNYGITIILLTVCVRVLMFPLSRKQHVSMHKMQKLQPLMKEINEKYKNDRQAKSQAMMVLYRKHKVNPLGGCLPLLLQLPIFIGLYNGIYYAVEVRQAPFLWITDLGAPDRLFSIGMHIKFLMIKTSHFNLLPLLAVAGMILQQRLSQPATGDPQQMQQRKMMTIMMGVFGFLFYSVSSGLCLYFITSSLLHLVEQKVILRKLIHEPAAASPDVAAAPPAPRPGQSSDAQGKGARPQSKKRGKKRKR